MKKSLSLLVAATMVLGSLASVASAADASLTTDQKYQQFLDSKVLKGNPDGQAHLADNLTRAEFATIITAVAGLKEDTSSSAFKDVTVGQWWQGAIQAAYNAGLVNGVGADLFSPKANVTVQEIIVVAARLAKLAPVADAKIDGAADWAAPYIQAAIDAKLPVPTNYTAAATRGQTIDVAYAVTQVLAVKPLSEVKAVANADDTITVTGKTEGADGVKVALGTADAVAATLNADGTFTYTTAKQAAGDYSFTVTAYKGTTSLATATATATVDTFSVKSATVLNGTQIAVTFSKPAQDLSATTAANYVLTVGATAVVLTKVELSDDKLTATLTYAGGFPLGNYGQLNVKPAVVSVGGKTVAEYKNSIYLVDTTAPAVSGVSYNAGKAKISFSEPLANIGTVSINGVTYGSTSYTVTPTTNAAGHTTAIEIGGLTAGTAYTVDIVGAYDTAGVNTSVVGNLLPDYKTTVTVPSDSTPPTITAVTSNGGIITFKYSEAVDASAFGTVYFGDTKLITASLASDGLSATFDAQSILSTNNFVTNNVSIEGYKDIAGNSGAKYTSALTLTADKTKPTVTNVFYTSDKQLVFAFSESLGSAASVTYQYTGTNGIVYDGGKAIVSTGSAVGYDANGNGSTTDSGEDAYYTFSGVDLAAGTYTFAVSGAADKALPTANVMDAASVKLSVATGAASTGSVVLVSDPTYSAGALTFKFNADLAASALNTNNFLINGSPLPSGTSLIFSNDLKTVVATLPAGYITASGNRVVSVTGIVDANGNTLKSDGKLSGTVPLVENVKPVAGAITVLNDSQLSIAFSENITGVADGISVYLNGSTSATSASASISGSTLTLTLATGSLGTTTPVVVKFASSHITDTAGNAVADGQVSK